MDTCKYKDLFGKPKEGVHSYRLFDIAIADVVIMIVFSKLIEILFGDQLEMSFWYILLWTFVAGIIAHRFFCVRTTVDVLLFG